MGLTRQERMNLEKMHSVEVLMVGEVSELGDLIQVDVRLVSVKTGKVVVAEYVEVKNLTNLRPKITELAKTIELKYLRQWIGSLDFPVQHFINNDIPLPLVVIEPNCLFKQKATAALDAKGIRWKVVYQSQSLSGIWPAVNAGIGITPRTCFGRPGFLKVIKTELPYIGDIGIQMHRSQEITNNMRDRLIDLITETISTQYG